MHDRALSERAQAAGVTLLAALLRFPLLGTLPPGLYHDEAINGLDALRVLGGHTPVFFSANNGREPLFIYLVAASIAAVGRSALAIRLVSAILGTLTVPALYLVGRRLFSPRIGLLAGAIAAIGVWPINLSRVGFRTVALPLFAGLTIWAFWRGYERWSHHPEDVRSARRWFPAAGVLLGATFYTYLAARFIPLVFVLFALYLLALRKPIPWLGLAVFVGVAVLVALPLLAYFGTHMSEAALRGYQVSILNPAINAGDPAGTLLHHLGRTLLMFNVRGDFIPRHNVPLRPVFDPLLSLAFLLGVAIAVRRWRQPAYAFILIWTAVMLLPTVLAEDAPHFLRAVGILPSLFALPALGLSTAGDFLERRASGTAAVAAITLVLLLSTAATTYDYFVRHARGENAYFQFETGATELAADINNFLKANVDGHAYIDTTLWDGWAAVRFLVPESKRLIVVDDATAPADFRGLANFGNLVLQPPVIVAVWPFQDLVLYRDLLPPDSLISAVPGALERGDLQAEARLLYVLLRATPPLQTTTPLARFGDAISLLQARADQLESGQVEVKLVWQCQAAVPEAYSATVQLIGPSGLVAQIDRQPAHGYYPTTAWRPGDQIRDAFVLEPPAAYEPSSHELIVALYNPITLHRLPVADRDSGETADHYVLPAP
jgi:4-amino-4-deoxy-L-arabinose transferase-like glycosyltransferase